jgi:RNA polymerase primary sigma factor
MIPKFTSHLEARCYLDKFGLSPKERFVLECRNTQFMEERKGMTLEEIGKEMGLTRERIRQIEAKALEIIRLKELK